MFIVKYSPYVFFALSGNAAADAKTATETLRTNRRHMVAVTQVILIAIVYVVSFVPSMLLLNGIVSNTLFAYLFYVNNISNFFIYLVVNKEFRKEAKNLVKVVMKREPPKPPAFRMQT